MATQSSHRIRLKADLAHFDAPIDLATGTDPVLWRKADAQIEFALFQDGTLLNVSNLDSVTVTIKATEAASQPPASDATVLATATITSAALDDTLILGDWTAGTDQHGAIALTASDLDVAATDAAWLTLSAATTDDPAHVLVLAAGPVRILEAGL